MPNKVSFLIATYNMSSTIIQAIESCLDTKNNVEVVVVNDGSSDNTHELLTEKYTNHPNVIYDFFQRNCGKVAAFNRAYHHSSGQIICFLGADDIITKDRSWLFHCNLSNVQPQFWVGNYFMADENLSITTHKTVNRTKWPSILEKNPYPGGASAFNRQFSEILFPIDEKIGGEDYIAALIASHLDCVTLVNKDFLVYRRHDNNTWSGISTKKMLRKSTERRIAIIESFRDKVSLPPNDLKLTEKAIIYNEQFLNGNLKTRIYTASTLPDFYSAKSKIRLILGLTAYSILVAAKGVISIKERIRKSISETPQL